MSSDQDTDELSQRLKGLALDASPESSTEASPFDDILQGFDPSASRQQRILATLALSHRIQALESDATPLKKLLEGSKATPSPTLRLLAALATLSATTAHSLLFEPTPSILVSLIQSVLSKAYRAPTVISALDLLSHLFNHAASRKTLATLTIARRPLPEWLEELSDYSEMRGEAEADHSGLWATLVLHKLYRSGAVAGSAAETKAAARANASSLYSAAKGSLGAGEVKASSPPKEWSADNWEHLLRSSRLAALESLTYLTLERAWKETAATDEELLKRVIAVSSSRQKRGIFPARLEGKNGNPLKSSYELDSLLGSSTGGTSSDVPDSALQYGGASFLSNLIARPRVLSEDEKNAKRLRDLADRKQKEAERKAAVEKGERIEELQEGDEEQEDERAEVIDARVRRLVDAGAATALVSMVLSGGGKEASQGGKATNSAAPIAGLTPSPLVRESATACFLSLTTPQDKVLRGKLIQAGLVRALLPLCSATLALIASKGGPGEDSTGRLGPSSTGELTPSTFGAAQALARLIISHAPSLVFGSDGASAAAILPLAAMLLHPATDRLQRFEAALALTNLSSVDSGAERVAGASLPSASSASTASTTRLRDKLEELIIAEDNVMARRSFVELLCNLVQDEETWGLWSGSGEDEKGVEETRKTKGKAEGRLHLLVALCAPALQPGGPASEGGNAAPRETSLKTRLAASGALASLASSPSACATLLDLPRPRTLNLLARLVLPGTPILADLPEDGARIVELGDDEETLVGDVEQDAADEVDEEEESAAEERDVTSHEGGREMGRAELEIRGVTIAHCLAQFLVWSVERATSEGEREEARKRWSRFKVAGFVEALKGRAIEGARIMAGQQQRGQETQVDRRMRETVKGMREQSTRLAFESLKALKDGGLMS